MMLISVSILLLVSSLYLTEEIYSSRISLEREMKSLGSALGDSCKKLLMQREIETTQEILSSLSVQSNIRAAYLFDETGAPVAQYLDPSDSQFVLTTITRDFVRPETKFWTELDDILQTSSFKHLGLFLPIKHGSRQVGSLYLLSDLRDLYGRLSGAVFLVLLLSGVLLLLSWWLSGKLQRPVSRPLLALVETMGSITQKSDFSIRANKEGMDEVGMLVDGFNRMLEQIESNRQELVDQQHSLEITVDQRTEELRRLVSVLEQAKQQAEAASDAKSQFLANITHELRTPLIGVLGMNELMFRTAMDEQQRMLASTVQSSGGDLLTLINNVLDFSKIEAGKMQLEETEFALYQVVDEVLNLLSSAAADKGLSLYSHIPLSATCHVLGDQLRIRQILMNLVGNAIKFTEQGAVSITLNCQTSESGEAMFVVEVLDTGIGMDDQAKKEIFSAFHQADTSHTRKYGGTGLGLAIVLQLVELLGGDLELTSTVGEGSCFRISFSLPFAASSQIELPETLSGQPVLLCIEDITCQQILAARLVDLGLSVVIAKSVADAWYQLNAAVRRQEPFQMAFWSLDAQLPDQQPLSSAVRNDPNLYQLRRVLLCDRSQMANVQGHEHKLYLPVSWDLLVETISQSWHELHLVETKPKNEDVALSELEDGNKVRLLLAGGGIAARELIKLALADLPFVVGAVKSFSELQAEIQRNSYDVCIADLASFPEESLLEKFSPSGVETLLFALCASPPDISFSTHVAGIIEKPFNRDSFLQQLQPLLKHRFDLFQARSNEAAKGQ